MATLAAMLVVQLMTTASTVIGAPGEADAPPPIWEEAMQPAGIERQRELDRLWPIEEFSRLVESIDAAIDELSRGGTIDASSLRWWSFELKRLSGDETQIGKTVLALDDAARALFAERTGAAIDALTRASRSLESLGPHAAHDAGTVREP